MTTLLDIQKVESGYEEFTIVQGVSCHVNKGERVALLGPNGAGKTTFLKTIMGLIIPKCGRILYENRDITRLPPHERVQLGIGLVPEGRHVFPEMSVLDNLEVAALTTPRGTQHMSDSFEFVYSLFPILKERENQRAGTLSGGQQQMLAIARTLMTRPELLMLDEPSQGLAPKLVEGVYNVLDKLSGEGISLLVIEQYIMKVIDFTGRVYLMERGRIVSEGEPKDLLRQLTKVYVA